MESFDFVATRLNCVLKNEVNQHLETGKALFSHKQQMQVSALKSLLLSKA